MALSEPVIRFLEEKRYAVLGTINPDGSIQQTVMWYQLQGDQIMMNTKRGRKKDRNLLTDRRVSICIEDEYRYLTISGEVELIDDQERAQADIRALAVRYEGQEQGEEMAREFSKQERITILLPTTNMIADRIRD